MTEETKPQLTFPIMKDEGGRYAVVPNASIQNIADAGGHLDLPQEAVTLLAEDATYRLREVIEVVRLAFIIIHSCLEFQVKMKIYF